MLSPSVPPPRPVPSGPDELRARAYAASCLRRLPAELTYHSLAHTCQDVVPAAERLAARLGVGGLDLVLLRTAAYFHDVGFIERRAQHETAGARLAASVLVYCGYQPSQIAMIAGMILATRLPQSPCNLLEQILADADLDSLGRDDFRRTSLALRAELALCGPLIPKAEWYTRQLAFLQNHRYFTTAAQALRDAGKLRNIALLERLLSQA
jgi:uncharacterized protein